MLVSTYHGQEDARAEEDHTIVLLRPTISQSQPLWCEDLQGREEARDAASSRLGAVGHGFWGDVWEAGPDVKRGDHERDECDVERCADLDGLANHATSYDEF